MTATQAPTPGPLSGDDWLTIDTAPKDGSHFDAQDRDHYGDRVFEGTHWYVHPSVTGWNTDDFDCGDYEFEPTHWRPKSLAPTAPVEASGSEREHGPKCWGKTSISDEMMYCYCGSTDSPPGETREYPWSFYDALKVAGIEHASFCVNGVTVFGDRSAAKEAERWHHESVSVETYWRPEVIRQRDLLSALALGGQKGDSETLRVLLDNLVIAQTLSKDIRQKATDEARSYLYDLRHTPQPSGETRKAVARLVDRLNARRMKATDEAHNLVPQSRRATWVEDSLSSAAVEVPYADLLALLSVRPLALGGQQGDGWRCPDCGAQADEWFDCCKNPARAEAQDEGAAGEPVAWRYRWKPTPRSEPGDWREPTNVRWKINDRIGYEEEPLYAHPSPTPAADADRVRMYGALERIAAATPENTNSATAARMAGWTQAVANTALAALKSTAAKEGGSK